MTKGDVSLSGTKLAPKTRFNAKVSAHRVFDAAPFKLADIRAIKDAVPGATVNDVILAIVGGGLRGYLEAKGELPKDSLTAMAPISVRGEGEKAGARQPRLGDGRGARHADRRSAGTVCAMSMPRRAIPRR